MTVEVSSERMHFVYTASRYHTNQHYPVCALLEAGHLVTFLVLRRGPVETYDALQPVVLGCSRIFGFLRRVASLIPGVAFGDFGGLPPVVRFVTEVRARRPSAMIVRDPRTAYGLLAVLVAKLMGVRLILYTQSARAVTPKTASHALGRVFRRVTRASWFSPIRGGAAADGPVEYVPFVTPTHTSPTRKRWFAGDCVNLLALGKFVPRKNHLLFLDAMAELSSTHRIRARIVGESSTEEHRREWERVMQHCRDRGLDDRVDVELNLPFAAMQNCYSEHDVFVLASRDEPAAVSPLEAMAHSLPVVCSDSNGTSCYIRPGENGFVFRTDDLGDLVACLDQVITDRTRLIEMGRRSYELVASEHAPSRYVEVLVRMASPAT